MDTPRGRARLLHARAAGLLLGLVLAAGAASADQAVWMDTQFGAPVVRRANFDGTGLQSWPLPAGTLPEGLAFDAASGRLIWVEAAWTGARVRRAALDLSLPADVATGLSTLRGVAVDGTGRIYWTSSNLVTGGKVQRAEADGSGLTTLLSLGSAANPRGIAVDVAHARIYFTDFDQGLVQRATLGGAALETIAVTPAGAGPYGIAVDPAAGKVYWSQYGWGNIRRANLDGSGAEDLFGTGLPSWIALDTASGQIYWASGISGTLLRGPLSGGAITPTALPVTTLGGIAIVPSASLDAPAPAITEVAFALASSNPSRGPVDFALALPAAAPVRVEVTDVQGRRLATLADGTMPAGRTTLSWTPHGTAPAGVYFARLETGGRDWVRRIVLVP